MSMEEKELATAASATTASAPTTSAPANAPTAPVDSPRRHLWGDQPQDSALARFLDDLYGVLFSPRATFEDLAVRPSVGAALLLYLLILVVDAVAGLPGVDATLGRLPGLGQLLHGAARALLPAYLILTAVGWVLSAAVLHLVAEWLGGHGRAADLFSLGAFYRVPLLFLAPLSLLASVTLPGLGRLFGFALALWSLVLEVLAIAANYRFGAGRAILTVLLPVVALAVAALLLAISTAIAAAPLLRGIIGR